MTEDPLSTDNIGIGRRNNKRPCVVGEKSVVFILHGLVPVKVGKSRPIVGGEKSGINSEKIEPINGRR